MTSIDMEVDRLFSEMLSQHDEMCRNPVTGAGFVRGLDPIEPQKQSACRALRAREWFAIYGPHDAPPLPVHWNELQRAKRGGDLPHLVAYYCQSLEGVDFAVNQHPPFEAYARGVFALPDVPFFF